MGGEDVTFVPDMPRRQTMNAILVGAVGVSTLGKSIPPHVFTVYLFIYSPGICTFNDTAFFACLIQR